ncbi:MAG: hypothetical protein JRJ37_00075 [Deltaproteobacteria bacterium]|nr:hypothetical protein [Deltaproteobacteria bacterium]MBW1848438.1 hypothetical protein [Deltaproteobacteria bacterium]
MKPRMAKTFNLRTRAKMASVLQRIQNFFKHDIQMTSTSLPTRTGRMYFLKLSMIVVLMMLFAVTNDVIATEFEIPSQRKVYNIFPADMASGPNYRIRADVTSYGYMHYYTVNSKFGVFKVAGDYGLRKLLLEIRAIAALKEVKKSKAFTNSVKEAAIKPLYFGKDLILEPVDTVTGIPKGVFQLFHNVAKGLYEKKDPSEDPRYKQALLMSSYKRDIAYELGVDVYSSNSVLQEELNSVGWAGALGSLSFSAITAPAGLPAIKLLKAARFGKQLNEVLKAEPPARLRIINEKKMATMGIPSYRIKNFLNHPYFTPLHDTVIVDCLSRLRRVRGRSRFIHFILKAEDEESANFFQNMAETMRGYNQTIAPIKEIKIVGGLPVAEAENGSALIPLPLDHGVWTERADKIMKNFVASYKPSRRVKKLELWVTGTLSPLARENIQSLGIEILEKVDERIEYMY